VASPEVRYARTDDGVTIAYCTLGNGPTTVVFVSPFTSQVELSWEEPAFGSFMRRLASSVRVVVFDRRGVGLSDQLTDPGHLLTLRDLAADVKGVLDALGVKRATILGSSLGSMVAVQFAVEHPERTDALVLFGGFSRLSRVGEYPLDDGPDAIEVWASQTARLWGSGAMIVANSPSMADSASFRRWAARMERHTCSPGMVAAMCRSAARFDVRPILGDVRAPALVLRRKGDGLIPREEARLLATHISGAQYVELPGDDHALFVGNHRTTIEPILEFLDATVTAGAMKAFRRAERKDVAIGLDSLTPSEREIAELVASGLTNRQVATRLGMSSFTVDGRLRRIFSKLDLNSRIGLAGKIGHPT
jgi:pimeloyl-ACP methyl ester carboxylesterase/DNA-binding CsgD family transcriptional regulator